MACTYLKIVSESVDKKNVLKLFSQICLPSKEHEKKPGTGEQEDEYRLLYIGLLSEPCRNASQEQEIRSEENELRWFVDL